MAKDRRDRPKSFRKPGIASAYPRREKPARESFSEEESLFAAGRNAVTEALLEGKNADTLYVEAGIGGLSKIIDMAKEAGCPVKEVSGKKLTELSKGIRHQGVLLTLSAVPYLELSALLKIPEERGEAPFFVIADELEDPHNLGALIRTAERAGAHGLIISKRRNVGVTPTVYKTSAGAAFHLPVARVTNLAAAMNELKAHNIWIYGCGMEGESWCETDFSGGIALVIGSEGKGLNRLIREQCDGVVSLPMRGKITSLNASVAGGIIMYEVLRQRLHIHAINR